MSWYCLFVYSTTLCAKHKCCTHHCRDCKTQQMPTSANPPFKNPFLSCIELFHLLHFRLCIFI